MDWKNIGNYFKGAVTTEKDAEGKSTGQIKNPELLQGGISVVDQFLGSAANNMRYGKVTDPAQKEMLQAVYGDANEDPLMRLYGVINGSAMKEATTNISNQGNLIGSGVSSNQQLLEQSKNIYQANHLERDKFGMDNVADNFSAFGKGFTNGLEMSGGNIWAGLIGGIAGGLANIGTQAGNNKRIEAMNRAQDLAQAQSSFNFQQSVDNTAKQNTLNQLVNMAAYGGFLRKYDLGGSLGDFNEVNAGGTHEQNPFGGVMVRPDASVEQGETITNTNNGDYVFSDRLKLSKQECLDLGVPVGSTYAKASKILRKEYDERPNDPISRKGWEDFKNILIEFQELQKQEKALKEAREQGLNSQQMNGVSPEAVQQMQQQPSVEDQYLMQGMNPEIAQNAFGGLVRKLYDGGDTDYPPGVWPPGQEDMYHSRFLYPIQNVQPLKPVSLQDVIDRERQADLKKLDNTILNIYGVDEDPELPDVTLTREAKRYARKNKEEYKGWGTNEYTERVTDRTPVPEKLSEYKPFVKPEDNNSNNFDLENLRYAPVLGNLAAAIKNTFTKPDYKYADRLDQMAQRINTNIPTPGNYNYMTYNPVDAQRYLNNYNAQANAARQGIMNTTNPSRNAALLAAQYNDLSGRGDLMQAIDQVNKKHYNDVIVRNNAVNTQRNADALNIANANFTRQQYQLGLMQQANALRQAEDEGLRAARAQQWSNALDSLGVLGQEASANNMAKSWFNLNKIAPGMTWEEFTKYSQGKGDLELQDDGSYKFVEK